MQPTVARWKNLGARRDLLWWLLPVAATVYVVAKLWAAGEYERIDFHIYFDAVRGWKPDSIYDYHHPEMGLGFTYPPLAALVLAPLTLVPFDIAEKLWLIVGAAASLAFLLLTATNLPVRPTWKPTVPVLVAVGMLTTPVFLTLRLGQINALLSLAVLADVVVVRRRFAGALIGLSGAVKLTPMYAVLYFAAARRWRSVAVAFASFGACSIAAWAWFPEDSVRYWTVELFATDRVGDLASGYSNSIRRIIELAPFATGVRTAIWVVASVAITVVVVRRARVALDRSNRLAAITIVMCGGLAVAPITWSHHLYFMLPALFLLIGSGASMARNLWAAGLFYLLVETADPGQDATWTFGRIVALLLIVAFLPIDDGPIESVNSDGRGAARLLRVQRAGEVLGR